MTPIGVSNKALWTGRVLSTIVILFLLMDASIKLIRLPAAVEGTKQLGYPVSSILPLGIVLLACVILYAIPQTAVLGAIFLTGYLGGAVATHVRVGNPLLTHILAPTYFAAAIWLGLWLRDPRVRAVVPFRARP